MTDIYIHQRNLKAVNPEGTDYVWLIDPDTKRVGVTFFPGSTEKAAAIAAAFNLEVKK